MLCNRNYSENSNSIEELYNPVAVISSKTLVDWNEKNISISGVRFDDKYQTLFRTKENNKKAELEERLRAAEEEERIIAELKARIRAETEARIREERRR